MHYSFGEKLKSLRIQRGLSQEELADKLNEKYDSKINKAMISKWENSKEEPRMESVRNIANFFGKTLDEMLGLDTDKSSVSLHETASPYGVHTRQVPIVGSIAAGTPILAEENIEGYLPVLSSFLGDREYFYLKVKGHSMNLEFKEGSYVLVEKTPMVENGQIAVILIDGTEATVKKLLFKGDNLVTLVPMSTDPTHEPKIYDLTKDSVQIIGRVVQAVKVY
ncbi:LexA family transcriptional regulator [Bacillus canaveralius]|uniref:LexA family transcriptional regulator n=1 Tax=Bacillus canaveralius TaxID=1403243 RepID=A0A2N5GPJ2_9BACI|nr:XRE family transcriptional regulator [Bacillus canaveralius]PLR84627.1 LexA family transcriptional regulator [Bacillus canaveralius]PLS00779.1 LexA family transcriptional regulator [Bacillus canaveralius]